MAALSMRLCARFFMVKNMVEKKIIDENKIDLDETTCSMLYEIAGNVCKVENWEEKFRDASSGFIC